MMVELTDIEVRVLGSLMEKSLATPEYYPLTLNALMNACNQKTNREPVVSYDTVIVNEALGSLREMELVHLVMGGDSRVPKYRTSLDEMFDLTPQEMAVMAMLMLRGPQTLGELRTRTERLYQFASLDDLQIVLEGLGERNDGALVQMLARQPGQKESRYIHLLSGEPMIIDEDYDTVEQVKGGDRIEQLEEEVAILRQQLAELQKSFAEFTQA